MPFDLDPTFLADAEAELGATLPASYGQSMLRENGGEVDGGGDRWVLYPIADRSDRRRFSRTCNHIIEETRGLRRWGRFPAEGLAIAGNAAGDQLVLLKRGSAYGPEIYDWSHETGALVEIAGDFSQLRRV